MSDDRKLPVPAPTVTEVEGGAVRALRRRGAYEKAERAPLDQMTQAGKGDLNITVGKDPRGTGRG